MLPVEFFATLAMFNEMYPRIKENPITAINPAFPTIMVSPIC
jgi:hypothetical protein